MLFLCVCVRLKQGLNELLRKQQQEQQAGQRKPPSQGQPSYTQDSSTCSLSPSVFLPYALNMPGLAPCSPGRLSQDTYTLAWHACIPVLTVIGFNLTNTCARACTHMSRDVDSQVHTNFRLCSRHTQTRFSTVASMHMHTLSHSSSCTQSQPLYRPWL